MGISNSKKNVNDGVVCSVENCVYHTKANQCTADTISVKMEKDYASTKDETLCATFENQAE